MTEAEPVGKRTKQMQPDMSDDLGAAGFHDQRNGAVTVHLASALPTPVRTRRQRQNPRSGGHFRGCGNLSAQASHV